MQDGKWRTRRWRGVIVVLAVALLAVAAMVSGSTAGAAAQPPSALATSAVTVGTSELLGVACPSALTCFAVGYTTSPNFAVIERWNGTSWSVVQGPNSASPVGGVLSAVACQSVSSCFAVGGTLIERWNGTKWSVVKGANLYPGWSGYLGGVSCTSTFCLAVGGQSGGGSSKTLVERWNGTMWSVLMSPYATGPSSPFLTSVSCRTTSLCFAAGYYTALTGRKKTLLERWDGTSVSYVVPSLNAASGDSYLKGVSCPTTTSCVAVGYFFDATVFPIGEGSTWVERWNGTSWSFESSPNTSFASQLRGVSCFGATMCLAVGSRMITNVSPGPLVERWNGTGWLVISSPKGGIRSELNAVKCASTTICFAVGHSSGGPTDQNTTWIARWNGTSWTTLVDGNP